MKTILTIFFILLFVSCNSSKQASTSSSGAISAAAPYLWQSAFPKTFNISNSFSATDVTSIQAMGDQWETSLNNQINFFSYGSRIANSNTSSADGVYGIHKSTVWAYPTYPDALAVTQIYAYRYNRGQANEYAAIQEADILLNYEFFKFDDPAVTTDYDLRTVILHEMGHFLGLSHNTALVRSSTVMYPSIYSTEIKQVPQSSDKAALASKYNVTVAPLSANAIVAERPVYTPNGPGEAIQIVIELKASGECVHHEDGVETLRHPVKLK